ncbi:MAG TPA: hypothetical protein DIT57_12425, partial [Enterococcus sp.]|nr:hypothetical protein [Enterococcus sp.]
FFPIDCHSVPSISVLAIYDNTLKPKKEKKLRLFPWVFSMKFLGNRYNKYNSILINERSHCMEQLDSA